MPLDPSIPLRARGPVAPVNPLELAGQTYQLRDLAMKSQAMQRAQSREQTIADLYRTNVGADGTINAPGMTQGLAQSGYGDAIPGFTKQQAEAGKATTDQQASSLALHQQKLKIINSALGALALDPDLTHDKVIAAISGLVNQGVATADEGAQAVRDLPGPKSLRAHIIAQAAKSLDAEKQLAMSLPKYDEQDRGGSINQGTVDPITATRTAGPDIPKTATPDEQLKSDRVRNAPTGYRFTADGKLEFIPGGPADPAVASSNKNLRPIPGSAATGIIANRASLGQIDRAIQAVEENPDAFGLSNYMGDAIKQRTDPKGVDPRAKVADIGSLKIHDRSGAAVTASETPRLKPFIPGVTDDAKAIITKLKNLRANMEAQIEETEQFYSPESGYRPMGGKGAPAVDNSVPPITVPPAGAALSAAAQALLQANPGMPPDVAEHLAKAGVK